MPDQHQQDIPHYKSQNSKIASKPQKSSQNPPNIVMVHHSPPGIDSGNTDSAVSSPRSEYTVHDPNPRVRFMCSFGGKIVPRPNDNQLRYVGGDTRIVAVNRSTTFASLVNKLSNLSGNSNINVKYQLPNEDFDALITVTTDEDVENMMEEYDRLLLNQNHNKSARLRLFLFNKEDGSISRGSSISSLLDGSTNRQQWFYDALNGGGSGLERGRSEVSSLVSEVPDYLFGLDNPDSPAPVVSAYCSEASVVPSIPDLDPVKTETNNVEPVIEKVEISTTKVLETQPTTYPAQPVIHHFMQNPQYPVYYVPGPVHPGVMPTQPVQALPPYGMQMPIPSAQMPVGYHYPMQGMGQGMRPVAMNYYDVSNPGGHRPIYTGMVIPESEELQRTRSDTL